MSRKPSSLWKVSFTQHFWVLKFDDVQFMEVRCFNDPSTKLPLWHGQGLGWSLKLPVRSGFKAVTGSATDILDEVTRNRVMCSAEDAIKAMFKSWLNALECEE